MFVRSFVRSREKKTRPRRKTCARPGSCFLTRRRPSRCQVEEEEKTAPQIIPIRLPLRSARLALEYRERIREIFNSRDSPHSNRTRVPAMSTLSTRETYGGERHEELRDKRTDTGCRRVNYPEAGDNSRGEKLEFHGKIDPSTSLSSVCKLYLKPHAPLRC